MMIRTVLLVLALAVIAAPAARADYFVWRDDVSGMSFSFPDTWKIVSSADQDDIVTVMAPSGRAHAACRVRVRDDGRYLIYPQRYSSDIQKIDFSTAFWEQFLGEYDRPVIRESYDTGGLGRAYAGYAVATYESAVQGPYMNREALMFAGLYNGDLFIMECSAHQDAFNEWKGLFLSIADSIDFRPAHHQLLNGNYRNFMADPRIEFRDRKGTTSVLY